MSGGPLLTALLVALAVAVILLPARRAVPETVVRPRARGSGSARRGLPVSDLDVGLLLIEVATLLRAGATPQRAWERCLARVGVHEGAVPGQDGVPPVLLALASPPGWWSRLRAWPRTRCSEDSRQARLSVSEEVGPVPGIRGAGDCPGSGQVTGNVVVSVVPAGVRLSGSARQARVVAAALPGAAAACRLTAALGAPLAGVLEAVALGVSESGHAEAARRSALSGPRTTARLLALLPVAGLALGSLVGARPAEVLLDGGWGSVVGTLGVGLMVVGQLITGRLVRAAQGSADGVDEALVLDLAAAALQAGASVPGALKALGQALGEEQLVVVGRALLLGASWDGAWVAPQDEAWLRRRARLEASLRPGWEDGASPGPLLVGTAAALRVGRSARDEEAAERLAVRLVLPLGLCFLPAFVVLGIVPVVASIGMDLLSW